LAPHVLSQSAEKWAHILANVLRCPTSKWQRVGAKAVKGLMSKLMTLNPAG
jgi:hypothetical protein